jgi:hypothetical protein
VFGPSPVPDRIAECGLPGALSKTETEAVLRPMVLGVKVTEIVHCDWGASVGPQLFISEYAAGFCPPIRMPVIVIVAVPAFENVRLCGEPDTPVG